jgi:glycerol-3-phosphate dehydrogenase
LSASTKPIHGGLRYLEYYEFGLVRKALREREILLRAAPHIIAPLRLVMPHDATTRPAWIIRAGLFLYDPLAKRAFLPGSRGIARWAPGLYAREVRYLCGVEWAGSSVDILWRRTKHGLHAIAAHQRRLSEWLLEQGLSKIAKYG